MILVAPYRWSSCLEHISAMHCFRYVQPACEQTDAQGSEPSLKDKWKYFDLVKGKKKKKKITFTATALTLIFPVQVLKKWDVLLYRMQGYHTLAQSIYSFEVHMNVWNKEFFASLRKYLQGFKQFLNEPHAASLKEGKNPGQSQKLSNIIHRYFRNFYEIIGLMPRNIYAIFCRLKL